MKLNLSHNLDPVELEEALEKALRGLRKYAEEPDRDLPDAIANKVREEANAAFDRTLNNMLKEIYKVISSE